MQDWFAGTTSVFSNYGTATERQLPVFVLPDKYDNRSGVRSWISRSRTSDNIRLVTDALQSPAFVTVSLRTNQGFEPPIRLLSVAVQDRAFVVDLVECPVEDDRTQVLLSALLETTAPLFCKHNLADFFICTLNI